MENFDLQEHEGRILLSGYQKRIAKLFRLSYPEPNSRKAALQAFKDGLDGEPANVATTARASAPANS